MLSKRENFLETIHGGNPDRFVNGYEYLDLVLGDPVNFYVRGKRFPGMEPSFDAWGVRTIWPEGEPGALPDPKLKALEDIEEWKDVIKVPDLIAHCSAEDLWTPFLEKVAKVDRTDKMLGLFAPTGIFERMHNLMGFEDTFCNMMEEPELMTELSWAIADYRMDGFKLMVENVHPDVILSHDDWGSKTSLFFPPQLWRDIFKPQYERIYGYLHDQGVIVIHHSDSFNEPIIQDMIDCHIDVWQGALATNDIVKLQEQTQGKIAFQGGIETNEVDKLTCTEEQVRAEVRRACSTYGPRGYYIPSLTYGDPFGTLVKKESNAWIADEIDKMSEEMFA